MDKGALSMTWTETHDVFREGRAEAPEPGGKAAHRNAPLPEPDLA